MANRNQLPPCDLRVFVDSIRSLRKWHYRITLESILLEAARKIYIRLVYKYLEDVDHSALLTHYMDHVDTLTSLVQQELQK